MTTMGLSGRDRHALSLIEEDLASSDPRFAARLTAFAGLAGGEEAPARERIQRRRIRLRFRSRRCLRWTAGLAWLAISMALIAAALVLNHTRPASACTRWQGLACTQQAMPPAPPASGQPTGSPGQSRGGPPPGP